ncbi:MAG TPA: DUF2071 domain-containing protein [Gemmatimonadaceae bacterium]|nr:DUF2071 domain-containing protein [Gemmatimonadaceae bacterium]
MFEWTEDPTPIVAHRPWPLPSAPWIMAQRWNNLLFAHWPVKTDTLRSLVPKSLMLDTHEGTTWVTITPFYLSHLRPRGIPAFPAVSEFPELNVRTYVTLEGKPGVYFFSLDAGSILAVEGARALFHLPYYRANMSVTKTADGGIDYRSRRSHAGAPSAEFTGRYHPAGNVEIASPGSLDHFLSERYCLYAVDSRSTVYRCEIHHRPWPLQPAEAEVTLNTMASAAGITLPQQSPHLTFARQLDVVVWAPTRVTT